jgi:hypothetical protein
MAQLIDKEWQYSFLLRPIGYCLLVLALVDIIVLLVPLHLMNSTWELQTIGELIERVPVPLLGLGLVFYQGADLRSKWERLPLQFLSWACLGVGVLFLLLIPLIGVDSVRLNDQISAQINSQLTQQLSGLEQLQEQLGKATTTEDLDNVIAHFHLQGIQPNSNLQQLKNQLFSGITQAQKTLRSQTEAALTDRRLALLKNSAKWFLGALISGVLFIYIWDITRWARRGSRSNK